MPATASNVPRASHLSTPGIFRFLSFLRYDTAAYACIADFFWSKQELLKIWRKYYNIVILSEKDDLFEESYYLRQQNPYAIAFF